MKKLLLLCLFFLMATFADAQITLGSGTTTGTAVPISTYYGYSYVQQIFPKSEINADAAGNITGLKFYLSATASIANSDTWVVYIGHTNKTTFSSTSDWIPLANLTKVFDGTVTNNSGVIEVTFTTPFAYNNTDNLVIAAEENKAGYDSNGSSEAMYMYAATSNNTLYYRNDTTNPDPAGTLPTGSRSANKSVVTFLGLNPSAIPACPTVSAPAADATGVSVTPSITWAAVNNATGYRISMGTTPGGTDILNNQDVGNVTTYAIATALDYEKQYYYTVSSYNAGVSSTGCTERSFTTKVIPCPTVTAPTAGANGQITTPTITWDAVTGATTYKLTVGTTSGGTDIINNQDLGNVTAYTFSTPLNMSTTYYYTVNAASATSTSASCTVRNFSTVCGSTGVPYTQDFETATTPALPACTASENAGTGNNWTTYSPGSGSFNTKVLNYTYNSTNAANAWFYTQGINLTAGTSYRIKYIYGNASGTTYPEKMKVAYGTAAASASMTTVLADYPNITNGSTAVAEMIDFTPSVSGVYYFGFNAYSDADMNRLYVDNISIDVTPACTEPSALTVSNITTVGATISWTAPATAPNGYEYAFTTTNVAPASGTTTNLTTADLGPLTPQTTYYAWVRSNCTTTANSIWIQTSFTTLALPPANDDCSGAIALVAGGNFAQNAVTGTTSGSTNSSALGAGCLSTPTNVAGNVWYTVTVPASGSITIETDTVTGTLLTDTVMSVFTDCTGGNSIACDDDGGNGNFSKVSLTGQTPGAVLYVSLWRYSNAGGGNDGQFQISAYDASLQLGTSEVSNNKNSIKVYPNPFTDVLNISKADLVKSVSVSDVAGRLVKTISNPSSALQLENLKQGMYLVTLEMKDGSKQTVKVIKK
ncbi:T9SS type A sorting domain-containing protein [Chryseobacterium populi]|nr:T9SS type A sorting domain-containing protein [Chryseobacterium populi]